VKTTVDAIESVSKPTKLMELIKKWLGQIKEKRTELKF